MTNVLVVTSSVRMLDGVHGHTSDLGPLVALGLVLVVSTASLHDGLVHTTTASDDTDRSAGKRRDGLLGARRQLDARLLGVGVVADDGGVVARRASDGAAVASLLLEVAHDGTLGHASNGEDVANSELGCAKK